MNSGSFRLRKYYLDCVTPQGDTCILYSARLSWGPLRMRYAAGLECSANGARRECHTYRQASSPRTSELATHWSNDRLQLAGTWRHDSPPSAATLLADGRRGIDWSCIAPRARAVVQSGGRTYSGSGYVERLDVTLAPWRLPFAVLHWGRFHSSTDVLVWIAWSGETNRTHVLHNGLVLDEAVLGNTTHRFGRSLELTFAATHTVHDAPIVAAVAGLPRVLRRIPPAFASAREVKWLSEATLSRPGSPPVHGWALHEQVTLR